ncbi:hypothetical protein XENOCAPTIV_002851 [Xenoophorus captivus]|uniref:Uncharacterized protein n=1 Tax=Xenoophorus captivus TaxID=1517983 RepID=A0ABV0QPL0_9TELE
MSSSTYSASSTNGSSSSKPTSPSSTYYTSDLNISSSRNAPSPPVISNSPHSSPKMHSKVHNTHHRSGSDGYLVTPQSPKQSSRSPRTSSSSYFERGPQAVISQMERTQSPSRTSGSLDQSPRLASQQMSANLLNPYDGIQMGRRSPQLDRGSAPGFLRSPSPLSLNSQAPSTLPRNFTSFSPNALRPGDVDAEIERPDYLQQNPGTLENPAMPGVSREAEQIVTPAPRPLSPTNLQPVVAPEVQNPEIPDREELLRIRAEIPRALKRLGSVNKSHPPKKASQYQPNQYKTVIHKLFKKKDHQPKGGKGSDSSSDGEEPALPRVPLPPVPVISKDEKVRI